MHDNFRLPVTIIIPAKQESKNIGPCLESLVWADQVYVVDSHSTDGTVEIAENMGATVVQFDYDGGWPKKKNWAIRNLDIRNDWIFIVDADERVPNVLREEIAATIQNPDFDGYYVRWKFIFLGRWMKHCWNHGWMLRLIRKGSGEYEDLGMRGEGGWDNEVHENIVVEGKVGRLKNYLLHESNSSLEFWLRKHNEFSTWDARRRRHQLDEGVPSIFTFFSSNPIKRRRFMRALFIRLPGKPLIMFLYLYLFKIGFLDGKAGLYFCALHGAHTLNISAKLFEQAQAERTEK